MIKPESTPIFLRGIGKGDLKEARAIFRGLMEDDPDDYTIYILECCKNERWVEDGLGADFWIC